MDQRRGVDGDLPFRALAESHGVIKDLGHHGDLLPNGHDVRVAAYQGQRAILGHLRVDAQGVGAAVNAS